MKKIYLLALVLIGFNAKAQYFQHLYGSGNTWEMLTDGNNAYSGGNAGHFLIGPGGSSFPGDFTINAQRTDMDGLFSNPQTFNYQYYLTDITNPPAMPAFFSADHIRTVEFSNGNGYAVAGSYLSGGATSMGIFYTHINPTGNVVTSAGYFQNLWGVTHTNVSVQEIVESVSNPGDLYITGYLTVAGTGNNRVFVIKIDQNGTLLWGATYDMTNNYSTDSDMSHDIVESSNYNSTCSCHEVMVVGEHIDKTTAASLPDAFFLRLNSNTGVPTQQVDFYGTAGSRDVFTSIIQADNTNIDANGNGFAIAGFSDINGSGIDAWFMALDYSGAIVWDELYDYNHPLGNVGNDYAMDLIERLNSSSNYEYYLAGYTDQGFFGFDDMLVIKTDANGNAVTGGQFTYGEVDLDRAMRIDQLNGYGTDNDGLAIYGYTSYISPYSLGGYDHMLVKAYFNGVSACQYDMRNANQISGSATHTTAWTGEYWPNSFYDFPFLVDYYQNLQDNQICYATQNADGSNARVAPVAPKGDKEAVVSPNPMAQGSQLAIVEIESNGPATVQVEVFDMLGKLYAAGNYTLAKGKNQLPVDLSSANMAAGMYTVKVTGTAINQNILLIVK